MNNWCLFSIFLFLKISFQKSNPIISTELYYEDSMQMRYKIGQPSDRDIQKISLLANESLLNGYYILELSKTQEQFEKKTLMIDKKPIAIEVFRDNFHIRRDITKNETAVTVKGFTFNSLHEGPNLLEIRAEQVALGYGFKNTNYSITHLLYQQKLINKLQFSITYDNKGFYSLNFGGVPKGNKPYYGKCDIDTNKISWGCNLIQVNDYVPKNNSYVTFSTTFDNMIYVPHEFMEYLKAKYFETESCGFNKTFYCDEKSFPRIAEISFYFEGNLKVTVPLFRLLHVETTNNVFSVKHNNTFYLQIYDGSTKGFNHWVLPISVFYDYDILFDYDDKTITFYSEHNDVAYKDINKKVMKQLFFIADVVLLGMMMLFICQIRHFFVVLDIDLNKDE